MLLMRAISNAPIEILSTKELIRKSLSANACVRIKGDFHLGSRRPAILQCLSSLLSFTRGLL